MKTIALEGDDELLLQRAEKATGIADGPALIRAALRSLLARDAARLLAQMGGTAPDLVAPPRRRFE